MYFTMRKELNCVGGIINRELGIKKGEIYISVVFVLKNNELRNDKHFHTILAFSFHRLRAISSIYLNSHFKRFCFLLFLTLHVHQVYKILHEN